MFQIFIPYYVLLSLSLCSILHSNYNISRFSASFISLVLFLFYIVVVSLRDFDMVGDTATYVRYFLYLDTSIPQKVEQGFVVLLKLLSYLGMSPRQYLLSICIIHSVLWFLALRKFIFCNSAFLICIFTLVSMFFYYNLGSNLIRQGLAMPFLILSIFYLLERRYFVVIFFSVCALVLHQATFFMILVAFTVIQLRFNVTTWLVITFVLTVASFIGLIDKFSAYVISNFFPSYKYILEDSSFIAYDIGFRLDFWLFTVIPALFFYALNETFRIEQEKYMCIYLAFFSLFIIMFAIPYSDRVGIYCWVLGVIMMSQFVGKYRYRVINSPSVTIFVVFIFGLTSFIFYKTLRFNYTLERYF